MKNKHLILPILLTFIALNILTTLARLKIPMQTLNDVIFSSKSKNFITHEIFCDKGNIADVSNFLSEMHLSGRKHHHQKFCDFMRRFEKAYASFEEAIFRLKVFVKNSLFVDALNFLDGNAEYSTIYSPFSDWTAKEFHERQLMNFKETKLKPTFSHQDHGGYDVDIHQEYLEAVQKSLYVDLRKFMTFNFWKSDVNVPFRSVLDNFASLPSSLQRNKIRDLPFIHNNLTFDWDKDGKVTKVKNQGTLGTCWAFSAVGVIESQVAIKHNKLVDLSVEQLVECAATFNNSNGDADCSEFGGWPYLGFSYIKDYGGLFADEIFPYCSGIVDKKTLMPECFPCMPKAYDKASCGDHSDLYCDISTTKGQVPGGYCERSYSNRKKTAAKIDSWKKLSTNETVLAEELQKYGPVSVALNAIFLQFYYRGVVSLPMCFDSLNHAVLLTGLGEVTFGPFDVFDHKLEHTLKYWRVKNSWGESWGENGYFRIKKDVGQCGINMTPSIAFVE